MTRHEIASTVEQIVIDALSARGLGSLDVITRYATLHDELGMDEADIFAVLLRAEEWFGVNLPDNDIGFSSTVTDIAALVATRLSEKEARAQPMETPPRLASPSIVPEAANGAVLRTVSAGSLE